MRPNFVILIFFFGWHLYAQAPKKYDLIHIDAFIEINPYQKKVTGNVIYRFQMRENTNSIEFDAPGIQTLKVKSGKEKIDFKQTDKSLIINKKFKQNKNYQITVKYRVNPSKAMYFTGWQSNGRKQVWTQGQGKNNSHWIPVNDDPNDKFTWSFHIAFPNKYRIISNGIFTGKTAKNDSIDIYSYKQELPAPAYLIFVGAGKYIENKVESQNGTTIYNYQYTDISHDKTYYKSEEIFNFIEQSIGVPYPWHNYKQIPCRDFLYGGMENVSATSFNGNSYVVDSIGFNDINFVNVSAHELTHQWFGDLVTGKSPADHWLHEGFATYFARLSDQYIFGKAYNDYNVYQYDQQIIAAQNSDTIPIHRTNASSLTYYQKGAKVVTMLRQQIGNDNFKLLIKNFLNRYAYRNASISDFKKEIFQITGDSLTRFFKLWLEDYHIPQFVLKQQKDSLIFVKNSHNLPIDFQIITSDSTYQITRKQSFKLSDYHQIKSIIANPENQKLYDIQFDKEPMFAVEQVLHAPAFIDRYKAMKQIAELNKKTKDSIYKLLLHQNLYYPIYQNILKNIRNDLDSIHIDFIKQLFEKDLMTRQQIALQIEKVPVKLKPLYKTLLRDASYLTRRMALWHYWNSFPSERKNILNETRQLQSDANQYYRLMWLSLALITPDYNNEQNLSYINEITSYASNRYNMTVRLNAFEMIDALQLITPQSINNIIDATFHFNWRLHLPARQLLQKWLQNPEYQNIIQQQINQLDYSKRQLMQKWIGIEN